MEKEYSYFAFKWLTYPLFYLLSLILVATITFVTVHIPALNGTTDYLFLVYLLILFFSPTAFALCGIPSFPFSIKALGNREPIYKVLGTLLLSLVYLSAGLYFSYHFTFQILIRL